MVQINCKFLAQSVFEFVSLLVPGISSIKVIYFWSLFRLMTSKTQLKFKFTDSKRNTMTKRAFDKTRNCQAVAGIQAIL